MLKLLLNVVSGVAKCLLIWVVKNLGGCYMWLVVMVAIDRGCGNNVKAVAKCG